MESTESERDHCYKRETTTRYATIVLDDGTIVELYELHGDADQLRSGLKYVPRVRSYDVTGTDPVFLYLHEEATEPARTLLELLRSSPVVVNQPFEHQPDGTLRLIMIGEDDVLGQTFDSLCEIVDVHLVETGEYRPELGDPSSLLTARQRHVLQTAVELGYYQLPRSVTHISLRYRREVNATSLTCR